MKIALPFKKLHPLAIAPVYATDGAACFDLHVIAADWNHAQRDDGIMVTEKYPAIFRTGLAFEVPEGWALMIYSRSGHGFKDSVRLSNCVGVIDSDYRGEVKVRLTGDGTGHLSVKHGDRIAQAMLVPITQAALYEVSELSHTTRGTGGFGSTGSGVVMPKSAILDDGWKRNNDVVMCALMLIDIAPITEATIATWSDLDCFRAHEYAIAVHLHASDNDDVIVPAMPAILAAYPRAAGYLAV